VSQRGAVAATLDADDRLESCRGARQTRIKRCERALDQFYHRSAVAFTATNVLKPGLEMFNHWEFVKTERIARAQFMCSGLKQCREPISHFIAVKGAVA
jgi:hypothetical protein